MEEKCKENQCVNGIPLVTDKKQKKNLMNESSYDLV